MTWGRDQRRRGLARTIARQQAHRHVEGAFCLLAAGYRRLECVACGATIALYALRRRPTGWEWCVTWHVDDDDHEGGNET